MHAEVWFADLLLHASVLPVCLPLHSAPTQVCHEPILSHGMCVPADNMQVIKQSNSAAAVSNVAVRQRAILVPGMEVWPMLMSLLREEIQVVHPRHKAMLECIGFLSRMTALQRSSHRKGRACRYGKSRP